MIFRLFFRFTYFLNVLCVCMYMNTHISGTKGIGYWSCGWLRIGIMDGCKAKTWVLGNEPGPL